MELNLRYKVHGLWWVVVGKFQDLKVLEHVKSQRVSFLPLHLAPYL